MLLQRRAVGAVVALIAGLAPAAPARAQLPPELNQDLVAYYPFDETAGLSFEIFTVLKATSIPTCRASGSVSHVIELGGAWVA